MRAGGVDFAQNCHILKVKTDRVRTLGREQVSGFADRRLKLALIGLQCFQRACCNLGGGDVLVHDLIDEGRVCTVLKQPANKIGQQVTMRPHRCINAAVGPFFAVDDIMQGLAHSVQALEFVGGFVVTRSHVQNGRDSVGIVRGKLRVNPVGHPKQSSGMRQIADISGRFAGENGEIIKTFDLGQLDFGIPIGTLDKPDHDAAVILGGHVVQSRKNIARAAAIGLNHNTKPVPSGQRGVG